MNARVTRAVGKAGLLLLVAALAMTGILVASDAAHGLRPTPLHSRLGSLALILIGFAHVSLQAVSRAPRAARARGVLLGGAFALWGMEQLLPPGRWTTAMDTAVIAIFVVDLGMIILDGLEHPAS